jgi:hypothetical protein
VNDLHPLEAVGGCIPHWLTPEDRSAGILALRQ